MIIAACTHEKSHKHGKDRQGNQRFKCALCGQTFVQQTAKPLGELRTSIKDAATVLGMLLEGLSIRSVERLTGICRKTICDMLLVVGENCQKLTDQLVKAVPVKDIQLDEIWSFVGCKERTRIKHAYDATIGDSWTFIAIDRDTKLVVAHRVGQRDNATCCAFLRQVDKATSGRFQLSSDGLGAYRLNVPFVLGSRVDFAQLIKNYAASQTTTRYSPAKIISAEKIAMFGRPNPDLICTSHVERLNLTVRMTLRRFTRLTNGHSKTLKHHTAMQALFFAWYNLCRRHEAIKGDTPAMAAGITSKAWSVRELLERAAEV
jgi:transposase-like protein/IS1 family transposase